jgi:hypothetical protein
MLPRWWKPFKETPRPEDQGREERKDSPLTRIPRSSQAPPDMTHDLWKSLDLTTGLPLISKRTVYKSSLTFMWLCPNKLIISLRYTKLKLHLIHLPYWTSQLSNTIHCRILGFTLMITWLRGAMVHCHCQHCMSTMLHIISSGKRSTFTIISSMVSIECILPLQNHRESRTVHWWEMFLGLWIKGKGVAIKWRRSTQRIACG